MSWGYGWRPYVSVEVRKQQARAYAARLAKKEKRELCPVQVGGKKIAQSFWGQAWCDNLEQYSDFENRLPRGRTYLRNGSIVDLQISAGEIRAIVGGSEVYKVSIRIRTLEKRAWTAVKRDCASGIASLIDLLQGRFDDGVMRRLTQPEKGLFPRPKEIEMSCSCPDWAVLCKHVAAVLYGIGARLDADPELLFTLRAVDHLELIEQAGTAENLDRSLTGTGDSTLKASELGAVFGIELEQRQAATEVTKPRANGNRTKSKAPRRGKSPAKAATGQSIRRAKKAVPAIKSKQSSRELKKQSHHGRGRRPPRQLVGT